MKSFVTYHFFRRYLNINVQGTNPKELQMFFEAAIESGGGGTLPIDLNKTPDQFSPSGYAGGNDAKQIGGELADPVTNAYLWPEQIESTPIEIGFSRGTQPSFGLDTVVIVGKRLPRYIDWEVFDFTYPQFLALDGGGGGLAGTGVSSPCENGKIKVDWNFISANEGNQKTTAYVLKDSQGVPLQKSGVTIATGFDIGAHSVNDLRSLQLPESLINKLAPFTGLKGSAAVSYYDSHPKLTILDSEANAIDSAAHAHTVTNLAAAYDKATNTPGAFYGLPARTQTAFADVAFQYGTNLAAQGAAPKFWGAMVARDFESAIAILKNFEDRHQGRHDKQADLMESDQVESRLLRHNVC